MAPPTGFADRLLPGKPTPLGATWDGLGTNFAVFSANAERIDLCLFDKAGRREIARLPLPECTDEVWHGYLPDAQPGLRYGYRAFGLYQPQNGHRFNPHKLLLDPYARKISSPVRWSDALFAYRLQSNRGDLSMDRRDSAPAMPKSIVVDDTYDWSLDPRPNTPWRDTVIYETHVKGISAQRDGLPANERGTFAALADPRFIEHLTRLGVTAIELLPIHAFVHDRFLVAKQLRNYWGYNTLSFFAPELAYFSSPSAPGILKELRLAIRRLHAAGIEVILDVVYNHTCEGNEFGPTLSWRGLDNASYYRLVPGDERHYINDTGCGNTVNLSHPRVLQMVMDSLRYWARAFNIDGFRFDLCSTLGREGTGFDPGSGFFDAIRQDPLLADRKMIAEPWDIGPSGYQVGQHPPGFAEWNDRFRDGVRRFWRGDANARQDLAARLTGSADLFHHRHRRAWASVNFLASHDGLTAADVVSYSEKHNEANGEDNRDGHNENFSANWGVEGPSEDPHIVSTRERVLRALLATLFLSQGTPMLLGGDEFGRSQGGNNNAYCQDNEISWIDWTQAESEAGKGLASWVARVVRLRRAYPLLNSIDFVHGQHEALPGVRDVDWFDEQGVALSMQAWHDPQARVLTCRRAGIGALGKPDVLAMLFNAGDTDVEFKLPAPVFDWTVVLDSAQPRQAPYAVGDSLEVPAHSVVVLAARAPVATPAATPPAPINAAPTPSAPAPSAPVADAVPPQV